MSGNVPAEFRVLFPLAPVLAIMALSFFDVPRPANGSALDCCNESAKAEGATCPSCCQKMPSRFSLMPKYQVKCASVNHGHIDFDAGRQIVVLHCTLNDLSTDQSIIGMSEMGVVEHLETDAGTVVEGGSGDGIISPNLHEFKNAPFLLHAGVPLATKSLTTVKGAVTVLRACDRASLAWREPFNAQLGRVRKAGDFEITLVKCAIANDFLVAEWNCKMPATTESAPWATRQLRVGLICADKSVLEPETFSDTGTSIRRIYRLKKKFPVMLDMSFVSVLKTECLRFELPAMTLDGAPVKKTEPSSGQNF